MKAIYKIEVELVADCKASEFTGHGLDIYYSNYDKYVNNVKILKKNNAVTNVKHTKNTFEFDTWYY